MKLTSILVCSFNGAEFVSTAIDSIYSQTIPQDQIEVIFVDDGSTDNTPEVIEKYRRRSNFRYLKNEANQGLPASCNRGIKESRGDFLIRLDDDDRIEADILKEMRPPLEKGLTELVYSDREELFAETGETRIVRIPEFDVFKMIAAGTMMRRDILLDIGGYRDFFWEEYDLYLRYMGKCKKKPYYIPKPLYTYTIREGSMTQNSEKVRRGWEQFREEWAKEAAEAYGKPPADSGW